MKKLTLIMLVAMVPFSTMAQKRSKKDKIETLDASYEFMIITGEMMTSPNGMTASPDLISSDDVESFKRAQTKMRVSFDFGRVAKDAQSSRLSETRYRSMAQAVNNASQYGWEFINANVVNSSASTFHYYYMRREK